MYERNRYGRKTEFTRKALIRYILDRGLKRGDRLPSQAELVQIIGTSSSTVIRAVNSLSDDGILEVRDKVGVFLRTNHLLGKVARTVALLTQCAVSDISPYYAGLALTLIRRLQQIGCQTLIFPWRRELGNDPGNRSHHEFPGLHDAVVDGVIDVVFDFTGWNGDDYFAKYNIPLLTLGPIRASANSIVIDMADFCRRAVAVLVRQGVRRLRVVSPHEIVSGLLQPIMDEVCRQHALDRAHCRLLTAKDVKQGRELAREFVGMKSDERPEGVVFMDEFFGLDFLNGMAVLRDEAAAYRPQVIMAYDPGLQLSYPSDGIFFFEKRVQEIADLTVDSILALAKNNESNLVRHYRYSEVGRKNFFGD